MNQSPFTDAQLVGRLIDGDGEAARSLIERYRRPLHLLLRRALGCAPEADDAFQTIWLRVVRSAERYDPLQAFDRWLFAIAWNVVRDEWRRRGVRSTDPLPADLVDRGPSAEQTVLLDDRSRRARDAVSRLPEPIAAVIFLRYFEELTEREVADRLKVPVGTVKSRAHSGLARLRTILNGGEL